MNIDKERQLTSISSANRPWTGPSLAIGDGAQRRAQSRSMDLWPRLLRALVPALFIFAPLHSRTATAAQTFWHNPSLGDWFISTNWGNGLPNLTSGTDGIIANGGTALIASPLAEAPNLFVGVPTTLGNIGTLLLGASGPNTVGSLWVPGTIVVGRSTTATPSTGALNISGGATLTQGNNYFSVGYGTQASNGSFNISGTNSYASVTTLYVGRDAGHGVLTVQSGGTLQSSAAVLAEGSGSSGSATVTGADSVWFLPTYPLDVGRVGTGSLTVSSGGFVQNRDATIGATAGSNGIATVTGNGALWETDRLFVGGGVADDGNGGTAALRILDGGRVRTGYLRINANDTVEVNNGSTAIDGLTFDRPAVISSQPAFEGTLTVGSTGAGRMTVGNRGVLVSQYLNIGMDAGSNGSVLFTGEESECVTQELAVGVSGNGTLEIRDDAFVINHSRAYLGFASGSSGSALVTDDGSWSLDSGGSLFVGNGGNGSLEVRNGGSVFVNGRTYVGFSSGALGNVVVSGRSASGSHSWLDVYGGLYVGGNAADPGGTGVLRVEDGGLVTGSTVVYNTGYVQLSANPTQGQFTFLGGHLQILANTIVWGNVSLGLGGVLVQTYGFSATLNGDISGPGGLTLSFLGATPTGTLTLSGTNTYTGATTIQGGRLVVDGSITSDVTVNNGGTLGGSGAVGGVTVNNGGTVAPGNSPGKLTVNGNYIQTSGGILNIEIGGNTPGNDYDQLEITGTASLDGTLNLTLVNGFIPAVGDTFAIIASSAEMGNFSTINSRGFTVSADASSEGIVLTVASVYPVQEGPTFTVTNTAEHDDGACTTDDCTLAEAVNAANANVDASTIYFAPGVEGTILNTASNGLLIGAPLTIQGPGARLLAISGHNVARVFVTHEDVTISGLTISQGSAPDDGGAIYNLGQLTLTGLYDFEQQRP